MMDALKDLLDNKNGLYMTCKTPLLKGMPIRISNTVKLDLESMKLKAIAIEKRLESQRRQRKEHLLKACQCVEERMERNKFKPAKSDSDVNDNYYQEEVKTVSPAFEEARTSSILNIVTSPEESLHQKKELFVNAASSESLQKQELFSPEASQIMHHTMEGLQVLKEEQEDLDMWYEMEKVKLAERYDRMRLMNIQKQKSVIESSHDLLLATSMDKNDTSTSSRSSSIQISPLAHLDLHTVNSNLDKNNTPGMQSTTHHDNICTIEKRIFEINNNTHMRGTSSQQHPNNLVQSMHVSIDGNVASSSSVKKCETSPVQYNNKKLTFEDQATSTSNNNTNDYYSNKLTYSESNTDTTTPPVKTLGTEFVMRFHQSMDAKLRRKSRAIKFFPTPESKTKKTQSSNQNNLNSLPDDEYLSDSSHSSSCIKAARNTSSVFGTPVAASAENMAKSLAFLDKGREEFGNSSSQTNNKQQQYGSNTTSSPGTLSTVDSLPHHSHEPQQWYDGANKDNKLVISPPSSEATAADAKSSSDKNVIKTSLDNLNQQYDLLSINDVMEQIADSPGIGDGILQRHEIGDQASPSSLCFDEGVICMTGKKTPTGNRPQQPDPDFISTAEEKDNATSTPHEPYNGQTPYLERYHQNLSFIYADEMPMVDYCNEIYEEESNALSSTAPSRHPPTTEKLLAVYKGFVIRRLMKTRKVVELVKTIKDTRSFLSEIDKENNHTGRMNLADRHLRARLLDEVSTKHRKLLDTYSMEAKDQWKLINTDRKQRQQLQDRKQEQQQQQDKQRASGSKPRSSVMSDKKRPKTAPTTTNKKLSIASQKSMKRRQEKLYKITQKVETIYVTLTIVTTGFREERKDIEANPKSTIAHIKPKIPTELTVRNREKSSQCLRRS